MSILLQANKFVYIKTPIRYTQTLFQEAFVGHLRSAMEVVGHKTQNMTHKNICGTWVTHNDRVRPAVEVRGRGVAA